MKQKINTLWNISFSILAGKRNTPKPFNLKTALSLKLPKLFPVDLIEQAVPRDGWTVEKECRMSNWNDNDI